MLNISIAASNTKDTVQQVQEVIGGNITEAWGEHILDVSNVNANGNIRYITFNWGGSLLQYNITFFDDVLIKLDTSEFNPIKFIYVSEGYCHQKFEKETKKHKLEPFKPVIITGKDGGYNLAYFPKKVKLQITIIQIKRIVFLKKRLNDTSSLNKQLYDVFQDTNHENAYAYFGSFNLKMAQLIKRLNKVNQKGIMRVLLIEGIVYQILALHMLHHNKDLKARKNKSPLSKTELQLVRKISKKILKDVSKDYNVEELALAVGLTQAKLQDGFKYLFSRTVIEYIRHVRLEKARELLNTTDLNISQVIYSIGFSSRSYFSKIFKTKYGISPSAFLKSKKDIHIKA